MSSKKIIRVGVWYTVYCICGCTFGTRIIAKVSESMKRIKTQRCVTLSQCTSNCLCFCKTNTKAGISRNTAVASVALQLEDSKSCITRDAQISMDGQGRGEGVVTLTVDVSQCKKISQISQTSQIPQISDFETRGW